MNLVKKEIFRNVVGGGSAYSTNKLDDVFSELLDVLKIDDESIYGKLAGKGEETVKAYVENLEYDVLIERNKKDIEYTDYKYFKFMNSKKMEKYEIKYRDMSGSEHPDVLYVSMIKIDEYQLNKYIDKYGKENEMKKIKSILDQDLTEEYLIGYGE